MKRASLNFSLEQVIGLLLAAVLIPGLILFAFNILSILESKPDQGTLNSFEQLSLVISDLINKTPSDKGITTTRNGDIIKVYPSVQNAVSVEVPYYLKKDIALVGFDSDTMKVKSTLIGVVNEYSVKRPGACLNRRCICLIKDFSKDMKEKDVVQCAVLYDVRLISASDVAPYVATSQTESDIKTIGLVHGNGVYLAWIPKNNLPVRNIRIIKFPVEGQQGTYDILFQLLPNQ